MWNSIIHVKNIQLCTYAFIYVSMHVTNNACTTDPLSMIAQMWSLFWNLYWRPYFMLHCLCKHNISKQANSIANVCMFARIHVLASNNSFQCWANFYISPALVPENNNAFLNVPLTYHDMFAVLLIKNTLCNTSDRWL